MLEGSNESAVITDSNWERVSGKSPTYDNHIRYTFSVDGSPHAGTAVRNVSHVDNKWSVGTTTSVKYLTPTDYDMVGNEGTGSSILLLLLLSFTATLALCIAITPFFWVYPRNDYEKKLLTRSASYADDGVPYTTMRPDSGLNSNDTYVSIQNKMREARGPASVLLTLSGAAVMAFFILSPGFLIFAPDSFAYGAGMFGCSVLAVFFLWLEGVYLRRGKHRTRYAYVRYIHDQIIRHRTETKKGAS